ncbi:MAG: hypothetical protein M1495_20430 [Bacteroidetes bacterium]|nr:hypothetical protein [Bacteroidota bacterium]
MKNGISASKNGKMKEKMNITHPPNPILLNLPDFGGKRRKNRADSIYFLTIKNRRALWMLPLIICSEIAAH